MIKVFLFILIHLFGNMPEEVIAAHDFLSLGVVDRVEGNVAIILLEDVEKEIQVYANRYIKEGEWLLIYWSDKQPFILASLENYEKERQEKIKVLQEKLREKESTNR